MYNISMYKFDAYLLEKKLNKWIKMRFKSEDEDRMMEYSNPLKEVVLAMCEPDPKNRITSS